MNVAQLIDHTLLKPDATENDIALLCEEALQYKFYSVCVNPVHIRYVVSILNSSTIGITTVVGFPLGANLSKVKSLEAQLAIADGASEIDMVMNIGALKQRDDDLVLQDILAVVQTCHERDGIVCKLILEVSLLTEEEKRRACQLAIRAGMDFVKTSTGFSSHGATVEDVELLSTVVAPHGLRVKAAGGIRTLADAERMIAAGATRIGSSNSVQIVREAQAAR